MAHWFKLPFGVVLSGRHGQTLWRFGTGSSEGAVSLGHSARPPVVPGAGTRDSLTGLMGRELFLQYVAGELERIRRGGPDGCLAMLDLDEFKGINDRFGHAAGDDVLQQVAAVVAGTARAGDVAARLGGDEICLLLPQTSLGDAVSSLTRINDTITSKVALAPDTQLTASVGVTRLDPSVRSVGDLFRYADNAMYYAKANQRGGVAVARKGMSARLREERAELAAAAATDQRTGLANAARFEHDWELLHSQMCDGGQPYGLLVADVDRFHDYNRTHGMRAGDDALRAIAAVLDAVPGGTAYRYGGEEFTLLMPSVAGQAEVHLTGGSIVTAVRQLGLPHEGRQDGSAVVTVTVSGAFVDWHDDDRHSAFDRVDNALVHGKAAGRDRYIQADR